MEYIWILLPAMILALYAQAKVKSTFQRYAKISNAYGLSGVEIAKRLLESSGIHDVRIEEVRGTLTDHYDPTHKVLRLSESVYNSTSLSAVGVAAHETGHAIQDARSYGPLVLRSALVPLTKIGSKSAMPLILAGLLFGSQAGSDFGYMLVQLGIIFFALAVAFAFVTLPVEFNASRRAVTMLEENALVSTAEIRPIKQVLNAAALTYVASAAVALAQLLRLMAIFGRRRN